MEFYVWMWGSLVGFKRSLWLLNYKKIMEIGNKILYNFINILKVNLWFI